MKLDFTINFKEIINFIEHRLSLLINVAMITGLVIIILV